MSLRFTACSLVVAFFSSFAFGADDAVLPLPTASLAEELNQKWSYSFDLHGAVSSGVGLTLQTPLAWNIFSLRTGVNIDSIRSGSLRFSYLAIPVGLRMNTVLDSTANLFPYLQINANFFLMRDADRQSSETIGAEVLYGAEWRYRAHILSRDEVDASVFVEAGFANSNVQLSTAQGGAYVGDGFVTRLGLRRFF